jgi:hypothetical protein
MFNVITKDFFQACITKLVLFDELETDVDELEIDVMS